MHPFRTFLCSFPWFLSLVGPQTGPWFWLCCSRPQGVVLTGWVPTTFVNHRLQRQSLEKCFQMKKYWKSYIMTNSIMLVKNHYSFKVKLNVAPQIWHGSRWKKWPQSSTWPYRYYLTSVHYFISSDRCIIYSWYHEESPLEGSQEPSLTILIRSFLLKKMKILGQGSPEWFLVSWTSGTFKMINLVSNLPLAGVPKGLRLRCLGTFMGCCSSLKWGTISTFIGISRGVRCI